MTGSRDLFVCGVASLVEADSVHALHTHDFLHCFPCPGRKKKETLGRGPTPRCTYVLLTWKDALDHVFTSSKSILEQGAGLDTFTSTPSSEKFPKLRITKKRQQ